MFIEFIIRLALNPLIEIYNQQSYGEVPWEGNAAYEVHVPFCKVWKYSHYSEIRA